MKISLSQASLFALILATSSLYAADKTYQVTGPVLEVTPTTIVVEKGKERWELLRDAATKTATEPKVGDKVTIHYTMTAKEIEAKPVAGAATAEKPAAKKAK